ncbi:glycoside hydrolase family 32 protein [Agromyces aurantiacus]|uniref:Glycoside hydrolase family 32 protein n=1 Tax=Agromyces aurantiacus TaxID=165814 RepID=A0ABV9R3Y7_9MICO|nr:glycoside hydrolase family 32 protein [Agromyces aurantiacus]MBM7503536.1 levanbiose-producing levanase [Agromyces aurantiacus]
MNRTTPPEPRRGRDDRSGTQRSRRKAIIPWLAAGLVIAGLVSAALIVQANGGAPSEPAPTATEPGPDADVAYTRPSDWSAYRPAVHLTPAERWMNDPQRPFWLDGRWHYYYLYNPDYPDANGTEWYHATSTDLVHWREEGIAIEKYENGLGDILTGSAVVDTDDSAGFGAGAVIALVTQQLDGVQRQSLFVSTDGGYRFESYEGNPVMENPGAEHWRDPKVDWDDERGEWRMVLAEGHKLGFYTSPDLRSWTYRSGFERDDLGILECPDLFEMSVDGDPSTTRWVLAAGVNGELYGMTTGTAYWIGDWDGRSFTPDSDEPQWLDRGSDFYAAVTWDDPRLGERDRLASRLAIGWLNNWSYASDLPTDGWSGGADSVVRELRLVDEGERMSLRSTPVDSLDALEGDPQVLDSAIATPEGDLLLPQPTSDAYRLRVTLAPDPADPADEVRFRVLEGGGRFATVGVDFASGTAFVARDADAAASAMPDAYREVRTAPATPSADGTVALDLIVDASSVEVFVNGGESALSSLAFGMPHANALTVESVSGATRIDRFELAPLAVAPVERAG